MVKELVLRDAAATADPLWVRITAFLTLKTRTTQATYIGVINEWCAFLGVEPGSSEAARRLLGATELEALAYRHLLFRKPGQAPRARTSLERSIERRSTPSRGTSTGLEATQTNNTIAKKLAILRRIYRLLMAAGLPIVKNPFDSDTVEPPRKESGQKRPTNMLRYEQVKSVIDAPGTKTLKTLQETTILALLFGCGLRRSEVVNLRMTDIRRTSAVSYYLYLRATKGKRDAEQIVPEFAATFLVEHYQQRIDRGASDLDFVFVGFTGKGGKIPKNTPVSATAVYDLFKRCCRKAGIDEFVSPHSARATAITKLLDQGFAHRDVQHFSRHASVQMVETYDKRRLNVESNPGKKLSYE